MKKHGEQIRVCDECRHGRYDTKFENLSVDGKPTLIICPFQTWKRNLKERACGFFEPKKQ